MEEFLCDFNDRMKTQKRWIILFLDNAACHPKVELLNIKTVFLPPNTTAVTQPLDQGIIQNMKCDYHKYLLCCLIHNYNNITSVAEATRTVTVLDAIMWISKAVNDILPSTIQNCFAKSGLLHERRSWMKMKCPKTEEECVIKTYDTVKSLKNVEPA
ncbi:hypothetical protein ILUMI_04655 [Ignelater luminosus]|uniref:DDE-1 domain-containing protein n=1 Tax=Ignelater luminosus TaxID=2038154 RepID=A0A8K0DC45_IGNLU|nr:hypothetical protein ILUMI_04655 [Ignelater luminosus]